LRLGYGLGLGLGLGSKHRVGLKSLRVAVSLARWAESAAATAAPTGAPAHTPRHAVRRSSAFAA